LNPVDLISSLPWRQAVFTTYSLSLSFFEAVVLDALVRGGGREALILSDVAGVQGALMEQGARRAGRDYLVEPIAVSNGGVFHPKISAFVAADDCHMLVGSGNLMMWTASPQRHHSAKAWSQERHKEGGRP
jgi:hypothetical protein